MSAKHIPTNLTELSAAYGFSTKYISKEFKRLAYSEKEKPPKKLGNLSPKRVYIFFEKFGEPTTDIN